MRFTETGSRGHRPLAGVGSAHGLCLLFALIFLAAMPSPARAGGGGITGGATEMTQIANNAELIEQVSQLAEQIQNQITMIQDMATNTLTIPDQLFRDVAGIYAGVKSVLDQTQGMAYNMANIDEELRRRFKSYGDLESLSRAADLAGESRRIADAQRETVRSTMEAIGVSFEALERDDASALRALQGKAASAKGRNELIQATNQLLGFLAEDSVKLRQLGMMQAQMTGTALEAERTRSDLSDRRIEAFFKRPGGGGASVPEGSLIDRLGN